MAPRKRLGQLLIEMGVIDEHQLNSALGHQKQWGGKLGSVLVQKGLCKEADVVRVLSVHLGMPVIHLAQTQVDPRALKAVSKQVAEKLRVFPVELSGSGRAEVLTIAMAEPSDLSIVDQIAFHTGKRVKPVLTGESEIATAIALYYNEANAQAAKLATPISSQRYTGPNVSGRISPTSQRPAPPHIAPPVMAPVVRPEGSPGAFGQVRPIPSQNQNQNAPQKPLSANAISPQPSLTPPYIPPPIPAAAPKSAAAAAPLEEIEPLDLESIPGMPAAPRSGTPASEPIENEPMRVEPIAAEQQPTSWDEAPSGEPAAVNWDDASHEPAQAASQPAPAAVSPHEEVGWADVQFSEPPPPEVKAALAQAHENQDNPFGVAQDWSDPGAHKSAADDSHPAHAQPAEEPTDELPADAIMGTAEELDETDPSSGHEPGAHAQPAATEPLPSSAEAAPPAVAAASEPAEKPIELAEPPTETAAPPPEAAAPPSELARPAEAVRADAPAAIAEMPAAPADSAPADSAPADSAPADSAPVASPPIGAAAPPESSPAREAGFASFPEAEPAREAELAREAEPARAAVPAAETPAFFEAPAEAEAPPPTPAAIAAAAPAGAQAIAVDAPEFAAEQPLVDPWADMDLPSDDVATEAPFAAALASPRAPVVEAAREQSHAEAVPAAIDAAARASAADAEAAHGEPAFAESESADPLAAPASAATEASRSEIDTSAVAPAAFHSDPGSIVAPDAWGEVADPLASAAHEGAGEAALEVAAANAEESAAAAATEAAAPPDEPPPAHAEEFAPVHVEGFAPAPVEPSAAAHAEENRELHDDDRAHEHDRAREERSHAQAASATVRPSDTPAAEAPAAVSSDPAAISEELFPIVHEAPASEPAIEASAPPDRFADRARYGEEDTAHERAAAAPSLPPPATEHFSEPQVDQPEGWSDESAAHSAPSQPVPASPFAAQDQVQQHEHVERPEHVEQDEHVEQHAHHEEISQHAELGQEEISQPAFASAPEPFAEAAHARDAHGESHDDPGVPAQLWGERPLQAAAEPPPLEPPPAESADGSVEQPWSAPPPEPHEGAGWIGQALAETTPLSTYDVEMLAGVGIDVADGWGALRLLASLLRALASRNLIDLGELTVDLYTQRSEAAWAASQAAAAQSEPAAAPPAGEESSGQTESPSDQTDRDAPRINPDGSDPAV